MQKPTASKAAVWPVREAGVSPLGAMWCQPSVAAASVQVASLQRSPKLPWPPNSSSWPGARVDKAWPHLADGPDSSEKKKKKRRP